MAIEYEKLSKEFKERTGESLEWPLNKA